MRRVHPLAVDADAVAHDPGVGQVQPGAAQHADAAHQHHPPVGTHGQDGGPHLHGVGRGGNMSSTQSIGPGAACRMRARSSASSPRIVHGAHAAAPNRRASSASACSLRPVATTHCAPIASATATPALPKAAGGAVDQHGLSGLQFRGEEPAIGHQQRAERAPWPASAASSCPDRDAFSVGTPHLFGPGAVVEISLQAQAAFASAGQALQHDVGR